MAPDSEAGMGQEADGQGVEAVAQVAAESLRKRHVQATALPDGATRSHVLGISAWTQGSP